MQRKIIGLMGICFFLFGSCSYAKPASIIPFKDIYIGQADHFDNVLVINDEDTFKELWTKHIWGMPQQVPKIDFSKETVIAVPGVGGGRTGLSFIITAIDHKPSKLLIHARGGLGSRKVVRMINIVSIQKSWLPVSVKYTKFSNH